jgi:hypothetical protein
MGNAVKARRYYVYALVSADEKATIQKILDRDGRSLSGWIRDCLNDRLLDDPDHPPLLRQEIYGRHSDRA